MNCRLRRLMSTLLVFAMLVGFIPPTMFNVAKAAGNDEKAPVDQSTYETLGFTTSLNETLEDNKDKLTSPYLGKMGGKSTMNTKNELYLNLQSHKNYGWIMRDNLNLNHNSTDNYHNMGAYELYKHYKSGKYDKLDSDYGYTMGQTGGDKTVVGSNLKSSGGHRSVAYETSVAFRSGSGKLDRVAVLYVTAGANRTDWVAHLEVKRFDGNDRYTISSKTITLGNAPALDEEGVIYNQYFDALYEIEAGDFDGDGFDEIAVYYGTNEIRIYDVSEYGTLSDDPIATIGASDILKDLTISGEFKTDSKGTTQRAAIVTLTAGDLKKDFSDELVVTVSMPQGSTLNAHQNNPHAYVFDLSGKEVKMDVEIPLTTDNLNGDKTKPQVFKASNAAIGDIDGDSCMELVIGGRLCSNTGVNDTGWDVGGLFAVNYVHSSEDWDISEITQISLSGHLKTGDDYDRYTAPVGMAVADLDGSGTEVAKTFFFNQLYDYNSDNEQYPFTNQAGNPTAADMHLATISEMRNNVNEKTDKSDHWISDVVVGNFNNNDANAQQILAIIGCKEDGDDWYWYYMSYMGYETETGTDSNGKNVITIKKGTEENPNFMASCEGIVNQGRSYINRTDKNRASVYVSIAAPDIDNDSILLEHIGTESFYSKPEVQAVLQSSPYFADVAEVYPDYLNDGVTAYGKAEGSGSGATTSIEASVGAYVETEVQLGGAAQFESEIGVTTSYEHMSSEEVETSVTYEGFVGDDYVVMYSIPYIRYIYNATFADGSKGVLSIEEPLTPATVIVPVDTYDELAAKNRRS